MADEYLDRLTEREAKRDNDDFKVFREIEDERERERQLNEAITEAIESILEPYETHCHCIGQSMNPMYCFYPERMQKLLRDAFERGMEFGKSHT